MFIFILNILSQSQRYVTKHQDQNISYLLFDLKRKNSGNFYQHCNSSFYAYFRASKKNEPKLKGVKLLYKKAAHLTRVKLKPCVNIVNILRAAFVPIFLRQKSTNLKCKYQTAAVETFVQKILV
jgi:hypothetical protein